MSQDHYSLARTFLRASSTNATLAPFGDHALAFSNVVALRPRRPSPKSTKLRLLSLDDLASLPAPQWLIEGYLQGGALAMLYGEPAVGKTFQALDWALSVATGTTWHGHSVAQGDVVYIYAEGATGLRQRADAWLAQSGVQRPSRFRALPVPIAINTEHGVRTFVEAIRETSLCPRLIVVDTLARNFGTGDENKQADMNAFVQGCDALRAAFPGATVLVVHHTGKDKAKGARGSIVLLGAVDTAIFMQRLDTQGRSRLVVEKQKDSEPVAPLYLSRRVVKLPAGASSCVLVPLSKGERPTGATRTDPRTAATDAAVFEAVLACGAEGITPSAWEEAVAARVTSRTTVLASRKRLLAQGKVREENGRWYAVEPEAA